MLADGEIGLVSSVTPVYLHHPMTLAALDAQEAQEMYERAETAGVMHLIDHELRFNPTRRRVDELLTDGYTGPVRYAFVRNVSSSRADPTRPFSWWSEKAKGGGALGAAASHYVDLLRWWLGEVVAVSGQLETFVRELPGSETGEPRSVDADDQFAVMLRFADGAYGHLFISTVSHIPGANPVEILGEQGSLVLDHKERAHIKRMCEVW